MTQTKDKKVFIFDLDGTLAESKQLIDQEMAMLLEKLLEHSIVAVISGGSYEQFEKQFLSPLTLNVEQYRHLVLLPTSGAALYRYNEAQWNPEYKEHLADEAVGRIRETIETAVRSSGLFPEQTFGETIENRETQVTYSALGQNAPVHVKEAWDPNGEKRKKILSLLPPLFTKEFSVRIGGMTSIDITKSGIHKAYGVEKLSQVLHIPITEMCYIGDALYPGGNDEPVKVTGIEWIEVKTVQDTKDLIRTLNAERLG